MKLPPKLEAKRDKVINEWIDDKSKSAVMAGYGMCYSDLTPLIQEMREALIIIPKKINWHDEWAKALESYDKMFGEK